MAFYAIQNPTFFPAARLITAITQATEAVVTSSFDHGYISGLIVRLIVPYQYGMPQINGQKGEITVISPTQFSISIDSTDFEPFAVPAPDPQYREPAQSVPIGERNDILNGAFQNIL